MSRPAGKLPWRGVVPPIPESRLEPIAEDDAVLMWVRHGSLVVEIDGGGSLIASAGEAAWLPPDVRHSARLAAGSVALPIIVEVAQVPVSLARPCVVTIPKTWEDWLLRRVAGWFGLSGGARSRRSHLIELLTEVGPVGRTPEVPMVPQLPSSPGPRAVIDRLRRDPALAAGVVELAADAMTSPRTLQRRLREETGHTLAQWRTALRIDAATRYLANGYDLGWTAHQVGYASVAGFTHAFTARVGISPGRYAARCAASDRADDPFVRELVTLVRPATSPPAPPDIQAGPPAPWVPSFDSVLWLYRGTASVEVAGHGWELCAGDVVWLPQGLPHLMETGQDSIVLPLGWKPAGPLARAESLRVIHMPDHPELERFLLHTMVANHFLLRPPGHDQHAFLDVLRPVVHPVRRAMSAHLGVIVRAVIDAPADRRSLAEWAGAFGVEAATLRREFVDVMGESFPRWRAKVRMTEARSLMWDGHPPSVVSRKLGYSHLPAFSKAFTASHGMPPREWLRREAD